MRPKIRALLARLALLVLVVVVIVELQVFRARPTGPRGTQTTPVAVSPTPVETVTLSLETAVPGDTPTPGETSRPVTSTPDNDNPTMPTTAPLSFKATPTAAFNIAPIPLVEPAADASGTLRFLSQQRQANRQTKVKNLTTLYVSKLGAQGDILSETQQLQAGLDLGNYLHVYPSPNGQYLAVQDDFGVLRFLDTKAEKWTTIPSAEISDWFNDSRYALLGSSVLELSTMTRSPFTDFPCQGSMGTASVSPDGQYIAYACGGEGYPDQFYIMPINSKSTKLPINASIKTWSWTLEGNLIFLDREGYWSIIGKDGQKLQTLKEKFDQDCVVTSRLRWSPDGNSFLVSCGALFDSYYNGGWSVKFPDLAYIVWVDARTGNQHPLMSNNIRGYYDPTWAPDGKQIAFVYQRTNDQELWVINADGTSLRQLTQIGQAIRFPIWQRP